MKKKIKVIYILGTSYSGSTMLAHIIGSSPKVFNAGEFKQFSKVKHIEQRLCSCGKQVRECSFWKNMSLSRYRIFSKPNFLHKLRLMCDIVSRKDCLKSLRKQKYNDPVFIQTLLENMNLYDNGSHIVLDASKSIFRLMYLMTCNNIDLKIIYIKRDLYGTVCSFVKSNDGFFHGIINYKLNHWLIPILLKKTKTHFSFLNYEDLCLNPNLELLNLGRFTGIDYSDYVNDLKARNFHIFTGNISRSQFIKGFKGFKLDESWKMTLSQFQKNILKLL